MLLIASTNRKDFLDQALLSRFTQQIFFRNPELKEIESILTHYL
jgi:AAA+ superfamily predicted ATPase